MKLFRCVAVVLIVWSMVLSSVAYGAEYYVTKSRSGIIAVTDHKPQGNATILKGPFETREKAEASLTAEEREQLGTKSTGRSQGYGQGQGTRRGASQ